MPFVPEERHGELVVMAQLCFAGPAEEGERVLEPFRSLAEPIVDMVRPITYPEMSPRSPRTTTRRSSSATSSPERSTAISRSGLERLDPSAGGSMRVAQFRVLGGAIDRVPAEATAYAHRAARTMVNVVSFYEDPEDRPAAAAWADDLAAELRQGDAGAYVNFLGDEGPDRVRAAYPGATWDRLTEVKATYDPANLFRSNQNIPPAAKPLRPPATPPEGRDALPASTR